MSLGLSVFCVSLSVSSPPPPPPPPPPLSLSLSHCVSLIVVRPTPRSLYRPLRKRRNPRSGDRRAELSIFLIYVSLGLSVCLSLFLSLCLCLSHCGPSTAPLAVSPVKKATESEKCRSQGRIIYFSNLRVSTDPITPGAWQGSHPQSRIYFSNP